MAYETDRTRFYTTRHADLFDTEREKVLPVWAQMRLRTLRRCLLDEAANHSNTLAELVSKELDTPIN